jgi:nicotinate-nucleotide adenylyltransferase
MGTSVFKNIAVLGGMFDPVHFGHLRMALAAQQDFGLDEVRLVPCHHPVHREEAEASAQHRIAMLHKATRHVKKLVVDMRECMRPGPSYMIETLQSLRTEYPQDRLFLLLGADAFNKLDSWKSWQDILECTHIIVVTRPGWTIDPSKSVKNFCKKRMASNFIEMCELPYGKVLEYSFTPLMISSSEIRKLIKKKKSVRYLIPNTVFNYIKKNKLYS